MHGMKIVSGGQTGVDRAALDVALSMGLAAGGWCPRDRWAEDGRIPDRYPVMETRSRDIHVRTQRNVECSSATLVFVRGSAMGPTRLTVEIAASMRRPHTVIDLLDEDVDPVTQIVEWLAQTRPMVLNVAGPKESCAPGITEQTTNILTNALVAAHRWHNVLEPTPLPDLQVA